MKYPRFLGDGDLIEIISPSNGIEFTKMSKYKIAIKKLNEYGFKVIEDANVRVSKNGVSADAKQRAIEFNNAIINSNVKGLIACTGGDFIIQILELVNYKNIIKNMKWIQGHSDITGLLYYITTNCDIATIYSFNAKTFGQEDLPECMLANGIEILKGNVIKQIEYGYRVDPKKYEQSWECITKFVPFQGRIIGGCLDSLKDLIGTKYDKTMKFIEKYKNDGIIWYFDVAEMTNEDILRTMWQFKNAGWFKYCRGIIFGRIYNEVTYTNTTLKDAINYNLEELGIPIIIDADLGHTNPVLSIINGAIVKINKREKFEMETILE